ncbi:hypothetical protein EMERY_32 [Brevibacillus phage Emery]|nr:hypothetical protein EMERY_32 [Brevibacillus phage Emery]
MQSMLKIIVNSSLDVVSYVCAVGKKEKCLSLERHFSLIGY